MREETINENLFNKNPSDNSNQGLHHHQIKEKNKDLEQILKIIKIK